MTEESNKITQIVVAKSLEWSRVDKSNRSLTPTAETTMFKVSLTNFGTMFAEQFETFEQAISFAKSKGFEATIYDNNGVAGSWSPIGGARKWR